MIEAILNVPYMPKGSDTIMKNNNSEAYSRKPEYLNQSDYPLLDNGYDKTKYAALSR
jgi:hypothetical protein